MGITSKPIVNMKNWELYVYKGIYNLSGTADKHPKLGKNVYISCTSYLLDSLFDNNVLTYETLNTIYICPLKYITTHPCDDIDIEKIEELTHMVDYSDNILDRIISSLAKLKIETEIKRYENHDGKLTDYYKKLCKITYDCSDDEFLKK